MKLSYANDTHASEGCRWGPAARLRIDAQSSGTIRIHSAGVQSVRLNGSTVAAQRAGEFLRVDLFVVWILVWIFGS